MSMQEQVINALTLQPFATMGNVSVLAKLSTCFCAARLLDPRRILQ